MKLHFLSGLPRSGSTLLTSLLYQNPLIHTEGVSALCDLMWNAQRSLGSEAVISQGRQVHARQMISNLPSAYYSETSRPIVIDKCRAWTLPLNMDMIRNYITPDPKVICCVRDIDDVVQSFVDLFARNGRTDFVGSDCEQELIMAQAGLESAIDSQDDAFLLVDYDSLVAQPNIELARVYQFLGLEHYDHNLMNITVAQPVDDSVYKLSGMHDVRRTVGKRIQIPSII